MTLKREVSTLGILFASVSAIIGSGWLFGSLYAAQMAGPAAILSWIIGGVAIIFIAFCFAELACMFPVAGGIGLFPSFSHGRVVSFIVSWLSWLAFIVIAPIEVQAVVQYAANYVPALVIEVHHVQKLTSFGLIIAFVLLSILTVVNSLSIEQVSKANNILTIWKLFVPVSVVCLFLWKSVSLSNLTNFGGFAPQGAHGVFSSLAVGGIILAFNGFQPGVALAGETKNPQKNIPIAIIGSLIICTLLYCLLQFSFLTAIPKYYLQNGWSQLSFAQEAGPLAGLSVVLGAVWLAKFLYVDALISPMGSASVFFAASARTSYSMSQNQFLPKFFQQLTKNGVPLWGIIFNFIISALIFCAFSGWQEMAAFYAAAICTCNSVIPLVLVALRENSDISFEKKIFRIPNYRLFSFAAFFISNLMLYWCGWNTIVKLDLAVFVALVFLLLERLKLSIKKQKPLHIYFEIRPAISFFVLLVLITVTSKFGSYDGGLNYIGTKLEIVLIFIISIITYCLSIIVKLSKKESQRRIQFFFSGEGVNFKDN
jgi:amino acid transporter